jgi:hypothetical protein
MFGKVHALCEAMARDTLEMTVCELGGEEIDVYRFRRDVVRDAVAPTASNVSCRNLAAVRAALGEEAFAAAWAEGRAMSLEQAITLALADD